MSAELRDARAVTRANAATFSLACRLLPRPVRADVYRLYATLRGLDDLVDDGDPRAPARVDALLAWSAGAAPDERATPETRVLGDLSNRVDLPRAAVGDFAEGMREDLSGRSIDSDAELDRYCYRVAGTVGLMMAALLGAGPEGRAAAVALGQAMQLTNILRDIDEDLAQGRRYLPVAAEDLQPGRRAHTLARYIARADARYEQGMAGVGLLPTGRAAVWVAAVLYREILRQIERDGLGCRPGRAHVSGPRKLLSLLTARSRRPRRRDGRRRSPDASEPDRSAECSARPVEPVG